MARVLACSEFLLRASFQYLVAMLFLNADKRKGIIGQ